MNGLYLAGLLVGIAGVAALDVRHRLFVGAAPLRAALVLAAGVAGFLAWDTAGIRLGIFFEGNRALLTGVQLAPQVPLEELAFLVLLCWTTMVSFTGALRLLARRDRAADTSAEAPVDASRAAGRSAGRAG